MNAKKAMRRFLAHLEAVPEGAAFEVGTSWDARKGWSVYQRIGDKGVAMSAETTRSLVKIFDRMASEPQWRAVAADMREMFDTMRACADQVDRLNREKVLPHAEAGTA